MSDIVWTRPPTEDEQSNLASWAGCIAGALEIDEYVAKLRSAGFADVDVELAGEPVNAASANITATKPAAPGCC